MSERKWLLSMPFTAVSTNFCNGYLSVIHYYERNKYLYYVYQEATAVNLIIRKTIT